MRMIMAIAAALALAGCQKQGAAAPAMTPRTPGLASAAPPARRAGLWEQAMTRDGTAPAVVGKLRLCIDAASEAEVSVFGGRMGKSRCGRPAVVRRPDGGYAFTSTCDMGAAGVTTSTGTLSGDLASRYRIHAQSETTGSSLASMNGRHVTDIDAAWLGPCPAGMDGGDVVLGNGMKIDTKKLGAVAAAMRGGR